MVSSFAWLVELHVENRLKQRLEGVSPRDADDSPSAAAGGKGGGGGGEEGAQGGAGRGGRGMIQFSGARGAAHSAGETLSTLGRGLMMSQMPWLNKLTRRGL